MKIIEVGEHRVRHGDAFGNLGELMCGQQADVFYTDPPWGQGALKMFQTLNAKQNKGAGATGVNHADFLDRMFDIAAAYAKDVILMDYGVRWRGDIEGRCKQWGFHIRARVDVLYRSGGKLLPEDLYLISKSGALRIPPGFVEDTSHRYGYAATKTAISYFAAPGGILFDPCCGMGFVAQAAIDTGMVFRGNELNMARLQKTIDRLNKGR